MRKLKPLSRPLTGSTRDAMGTRCPLSTAGTLTVIALLGVAAGIWIQALSGAAEYETIPPGPIVLVLLAVVIVLATRWWWIPLSGVLVSGLILVGAFVTPGTANRLSNPAEVGQFVGTVIQMLALILGVGAGMVATVGNYRSQNIGHQEGGFRGILAPLVCKGLGAIFILVGAMVAVRGGMAVDYHNLLHLATGVIALYVGLAAPVSGAKVFCLAFGAFYLALGALGVVVGDPAMDRLMQLGPLELDMGDHLFHLGLGSALLVVGLIAKSGTPRAGAPATS